MYDSILAFPYNRCSSFVHLICSSFYREKRNIIKNTAGVILPLQKKDVRFRFVFLCSKSKCSTLSTKSWSKSSTSTCHPCKKTNLVSYLEKSIFLVDFVHCRPSSLDAVLFAHLAQIMEFPSELQNHLLTFPTLITFYESIMKHYFSAALGEATSDNMFVVVSGYGYNAKNSYGMRISCRPTQKIDAILPYRVSRRRNEEMNCRDFRL